MDETHAGGIQRRKLNPAAEHVQSGHLSLVVETACVRPSAKGPLDRFTEAARGTGAG
jgi:hypothetical protein